MTVYKVHDVDHKFTLTEIWEEDADLQGEAYTDTDHEASAHLV
jgi:hypothetical protein